MKIAFVDVLGLPYDDQTVIKRGLGGSESAVIYLSRELVKLGHSVTVFNTCDVDDCSPGTHAGVQYVPIQDLPTHELEFDVIVSSRTVEPFCSVQAHDVWCKQPPGFFDRIRTHKAHKVCWLHDTFCGGDHLLEHLIMQNQIQELFVLSDWHMTYVLNCDHGVKRNYEVLKKRTWITRNGVHHIPDWVDVAAKNPNQFVYNASVSKGMKPLLTKIWPRIHAAIPDATLKIVGGYYKFASHHAPDEQEQTWHQLRADHDHKQGVEFLGIIPQAQVSEVLATSTLMLYPAAFPETFGISTLESLCHNTPLVTCDFGALEETAVDMACFKMPYAIEPNGLFPWINSDAQCEQFVNLVLQAHADKLRLQQAQHYCSIVKPLAHWQHVALQWHTHFHKILDSLISVEHYQAHHVHVRRWQQVFGRRTHNPEDSHVCQIAEQPQCWIIPFRNAQDYVSRCIMSVATQQYAPYQVILIDDASDDHTVHMVQHTLATCPLHIRDKFQFWQNDHSVGAVANQHAALTWAKHNLPERTICCLLDGDDWLVNRNDIMHMINHHFDAHVQFSYGSAFSLADRMPLIAQEYPPHVRAQGKYREHLFNWLIPYTHLRSFRLHVFDESLKSQWQDAQGNWFKAGGDVAVFYSLIERVPAHSIKVMQDVIVNYNDLNPLNDYKVNSTQQTQTAHSQIVQAHTTVSQKVPEIAPVIPPCAPHVAHRNKILIAVPTARYVETDTFQSIYKLHKPAHTDLDFQCFYGYNVEQVRNIQVNYMLNADYAWMLHVDADMVLPPHTLQQLLDIQTEQVAISSGVYIQRKMPEQIPEVYVWNADHTAHVHMNVKDLDPVRTQSVAAVGFGCCLVRRDVYEKVAYPWFEYKSHIQFDRIVSEDVDFCMKAHQAGYQIHVHTGLRLGHIHKITLQI